MIFAKPDKKALTEDQLKRRKEDRQRLDKLREEINIPWKELNKVAKEVVGREFGDVSRLTPSENAKLMRYLRTNYWRLRERYQGVNW